MKKIDKKREIKNAITTIIVSLVFVSFGFLIFNYASNEIKEHNEKKSYYVETNAKVVDYNYDSDGLKAIIVEYNVDGLTYYKYSDISSPKPKKIGTIVKIAYNPDNPQESIWSFDIVNMLVLSFSFVFFAFGIGCNVVGIKQFIAIRKIKDNYKRQKNGLYSSE